ncbi:glycosyltransferase family 2 protein [Paenibacillus thalictri]|uniref:glycosyltransferase family 2 protein n=1 Tax=Paenibacillus thalictri TaxID=2527873 RepID=UPI001F0D8C07|nr:glycosyltransferase [Paenibacillus thalictri]
MAKASQGPVAQNSSQPAVSVIIPVINERRTLSGVIRQAFRIHEKTEVIVVANGSSDETMQLAARLGAKVLRFSETLGHDVGRAVGAREAKGDILLFLDADMVIPVRELRHYVHAVQHGVDIALNQYSGQTSKKQVHRVVEAKHTLNAILGRPDLKGCSLTAIPHAIRRETAGAIGFEQLAVPPKAQAIAVAKGFKVEAVHFVNVARLNPLRKTVRKGDPIGDLILGDHLEAIRWLIAERGSRAGKSDMGRRRDLVR